MTGVLVVSANEGAEAMNEYRNSKGLGLRLGLNSLVGSFKVSEDCDRGSGGEPAAVIPLLLLLLLALEEIEAGEESLVEEVEPST